MQYVHIQHAKCPYLQREQVLHNICLGSCKTNSCMEALSIGVIYKNVVGSNEEDISPHTSQAIYFSKMNENMGSDREIHILVNWQSDTNPVIL